MADIQFHSSEIACFYADLLQGHNFSVLASFKENKKGNDPRWMNCIDALHEAVQTGEVKNIDELSSFVFEKQPGHGFSKDDQKKIKTILKTAYQKYDFYYQRYADQADAFRKKNEELKNDPKVGYKQELNDLCDLFGVRKDQTFHAILAPTPKKSVEGQAWNNGFVQYTDFSQKKDASEYIDDSPVLRSKISTPLHETTHLMFKQAGLEEAFMNPKSEGAKKLVQAIEKTFEKDPSTLLAAQAPARWNAVRAIDEAMAAATCTFVDIKHGNCGKDSENPDVKEWYNGFKAANDLAPHAFKMIKEYMKQNKKIDDAFFGKLADSYTRSQTRELSLQQKLMRNTPEKSSKTADIQATARKKQNLSR